MARIFGFDIGTTSVGFAVIDHDPARERGDILRLGVRIFPEARDPDGTPLNQQRRQKRMMRRQLRRRRRRRTLNECLAESGLLPSYGTDQWQPVATSDGDGASGFAGASDLKLPAGWEPFSIAAIQHFMPYLEAGVRFGTLVNSPEP